MPSSGDNINTGPSGFDINGDTYDFDTGLSEEDAAAIQGKKRTGTLSVDNSAKDLSTKLKTTLSQFLSDLTKGKSDSQGNPSAPGSGNDFPVDSGYKSIALVTTPDGNPILQSPGIAAPSNSSEFAGKSTDLSSLSDNYSTISGQIKKGKATFKAPDGNQLLPGLAGTNTYTAVYTAAAQGAGDELGMPPTGDASANPQTIGGASDTSAVVNTYISPILTQNRFSAAAGSFASATAPTNAGGFNPTLSVQSTLGSYNPNAPTTTHGILASIGPILSMRAAGELGATSAGADPDSNLLELAAILPGLAQLGLTQISQQTLLASDVLSQLTTDDQMADSQFILSTGTDSWGNMNDVDDPYSGVDALGMVAMSFILVAGIELLFQGLSLLLSTISSGAETFPGRDGVSRYNLGEYISGTKSGNKAASGGIGGAVAALSSLNFGALLGIRPTNFPFAQALSAGTDVFFQIPIPAPNSSVIGAIGSTVSGAASSSVDSPGFNSVVARTIIRSGIIIVNQLKKIGGSVVNAITQILALIDVIASSKLIAACNIFAMLGDAVLVEPASWQDTTVSGGIIKLSAMDAAPDLLPKASVQKNRLPGSLKLAWSSNYAPANLLIPSSMLAISTLISGKGFGAFSPTMGIGGDQQSNMQGNVIQSAAMGRIDSATAAKFEAALDAEYVPFYFHDVRTNEMITFHAFLASLTDDYAASYEKHDGFGRVEPVRIYKGTERKIGMSFYVAATSLPDFDDMWVKINKLITLLYPQYTQGIQLSDATGTAYTFTQPFSQLIGASPLVRIRLGDLFRSNYTQFALGRLFGLGNNNFKVNSTGFASADTLDSTAFAAIQSAITQALTNPTTTSAYTFVPTAGIYPLAPAKPSGGLLGALASAAGSLTGMSSATPAPFALEFDSMMDDCFEVVPTVWDPTNPGVVSGKVQLRSDAAFKAAYSTQSITALTSRYTPVSGGGSADDNAKQVIGGSYSFPLSALKITEDSLATLIAAVPAVQKALNAADSGFSANLTTFLDPAQNAIAKSFSDTGGKGLAGFIETMNFDWYDKVTWETQDGRAAPKMCKVTLSFAPVHDISPGIDHFGFNRAPIYPVGSMGPVGPQPATAPATTTATNAGPPGTSPPGGGTASGASSNGLPSGLPG